MLAKIGRSAARELFLTGRRFTAQHAQEIGLVHTVVPPEDLDAAVESVLREVLAGGREAIAAAKTLIADVSAAAAGEVADHHRVRAREAPRVARGPGGSPRVPGEAQAWLERCVIRRLLIANRGEIAVRIARACREMGIDSVAVYSDADATAAHVAAADRAVRIGPPSALDSYLNIAALLEAAQSVEADAVHPGYGFLSENAGFAAACREAGLVFVGPPAEAIARMGSKIEARRVASEAGVPVVPGQTPADQTDQGVRGGGRSGRVTGTHQGVGRRWRARHAPDPAAR